MARNEAEVPAQRPELRRDRMNQCRQVAARKVGTANRTLEQHIANENHPVLMLDEDHMTGRMSGTVPDFESDVADMNLISGIEITVGHKRLQYRKSELPALFRKLINPELIVCVWTLNR